MGLDCKDTIPQLEVAVADNATALIVRHLEPLSENDLTKLIEFFKARDWHLYLQPKAADSIHKVSPNDNNERLEYYSDDLTFKFHPVQFTQINHEINKKMIVRAIELLDLKQTDRVLDLFCGIGNFSLPVAKRCQTVVGIEGDETAVKQAKANAEFNAIKNAEFYTSNLFEPPFEMPWAKARYDKILLDPPRSGAKEIVENITKWAPKRLVYISCNPATLARDAEILCKQGYHLKQAGIMDMFPHTQHVEAITLFEHD
ncbi:MAG: 23S rRNA (uracil(1939)-C(5))-methyltransferase RlmD [Coxiellaceae bacterium]|nr:23S rRNA (uracil(1939)-C(5))-methyltransferase RlmD [Coxiellaceae bacterium]